MRPGPEHAASTAIAPPVPGATVARHAWPDVARGVTVLLVVAMHILFLHSMPLLPDTLAVRGHLPATSAATHLRMPLFFLVSGYLSAAMLQRSWRAGFSGRIAPRYYLYVVWLTITALALRAFAAVDQAPFDTSDYVLSQLLEPRGTLWYIWALALFFLVARATRAVPIWGLAIPAAILFVVGQIAFDQPWRDVSAGFLPFLLGARLPKEIRALTDRVPLRIGLPVLGAGIALAMIDSTLRWPLPVGLAVAVVAVPGVLMVLPHIAQWRILRPIRHIGRNTLAIFAIHPLLIVLANRIARDHPMLIEVIGEHPVLALLWPLALLLSIVLVALALQRLLRAIGLRHLFEMPRWRALRRAFRLRRATRQAERSERSQPAE